MMMRRRSWPRLAAGCLTTVRLAQIVASSSEFQQTNFTSFGSATLIHNVRPSFRFWLNKNISKKYESYGTGIEAVNCFFTGLECLLRAIKLTRTVDLQSA